MVRSVVTTLMPTPTSKLRVNDLIEASDHPNRSIFSLKRGEGLAQFQGYPFIMESYYHISPEEYERRRNLDWPTEIASTAWKRKTSPVSPVEFEREDDVVAESTNNEPSDLSFTELSDRDLVPNAVDDDNVSEITEEQSLNSQAESPTQALVDAGEVEPPADAQTESPAIKEDVVWDGDHPISMNSNNAPKTTDRAADVDPKALNDILKTLDEFNL